MTVKPRVLVSFGAAFAAMCVTGIVAFACIPIATMNLSQATASPGSQVTASIHQIGGKDAPPVAFHWMTIDGPVLATATPGEGGTTAQLTIPTSTTQSGDYLIIATEAAKAGRTTWGMPARAVIHVEVPGSAAQAAAGAGNAASTGPAGLSSDAGIGVGALVLIALATAGLGLLIVGAATLVAGRRAPRTSTVSGK